MQQLDFPAVVLSDDHCTFEPNDGPQPALTTNLSLVPVAHPGHVAFLSSSNLAEEVLSFNRIAFGLDRIYKFLHRPVFAMLEQLEVLC